MTANNHRTSESLASQAAKVLADPAASATAKSLAGSALSQRAPSHQTGESMEELASRVLDSSKYSDQTKSLAGSVLSQSNEDR